MLTILQLQSAANGIPPRVGNISIDHNRTGAESRRRKLVCSSNSARMILPRLLRHDSRVSLLGRSLKDRDRVSRMRHGAEASKARSDLVRAPALDGGLPGGVERPSDSMTSISAERPSDQGSGVTLIGNPRGRDDRPSSAHHSDRVTLGARRPDARPRIHWSEPFPSAVCPAGAPKSKAICVRGKREPGRLRAFSGGRDPSRGASPRTPVGGWDRLFLSSDRLRSPNGGTFLLRECAERSSFRYRRTKRQMVLISSGRSIPPPGSSPVRLDEWTLTGESAWRPSTIEAAVFRLRGCPSRKGSSSGVPRPPRARPVRCSRSPALWRCPAS